VKPEAFSVFGPAPPVRIACSMPASESVPTPVSWLEVRVKLWSAEAVTRSVPDWPSSMSLPGPPVIVSAPEPPLIVTAPENPVAEIVLLLAPPVKLACSNSEIGSLPRALSLRATSATDSTSRSVPSFPSSVSVPAPPVSKSSSPVPSTVSAPAAALTVAFGAPLKPLPVVTAERSTSFEPESPCTSMAVMLAQVKGPPVGSLPLTWTLPPEHVTSKSPPPLVVIERVPEETVASTAPCAAAGPSARNASAVAAAASFRGLRGCAERRSLVPATSSRKLARRGNVTSSAYSRWIVSTAARPSRSRSASSASAARALSARRSSSKKSARRPFSPSRTTSCTGAVSEARTAQPHAIASRSDQLSTNGAVRYTCRSLACRTSRSVAGGTRPRKRMRLGS
jgi:hypothetical protein